MAVVLFVGNSTKATHAIVDVPKVSDNKPIVTMSPKSGLTETILHSITSTYQQYSTDPFYVLHLNHLTNLMHEWTHNLPLVKPFYAVKCNPSPCFLSALAALGANFDCASQLEVQSVLSLGGSPDRIVFANPCKPSSHVSYAASVGVNVTTYDSVYEVDKIRKFHPTCSLLIRIKAPDEDGARFPLGSKYGALPEEIEPLLLAARAAQLPFIGVSFHVGSGTTNFSTYGKAIGAARSVFDAAARLGMPPMSVLDIGGGFTAGSAFSRAAAAVKEAVRVHFPDHKESGLKLIAEPGRYFAATSFTLVANVIGKRVRGEVREYWINDGIYGSMDPREYFDIASLKCMPLACVSNRANPTCEGTARFRSTVFGPTCDSADKVLTEYELPELEIGDWIVFPDMGAYSAAAAGCNFNGFNGSAISTHLVF